MAEQARLHAFVHGLVQGVNFRWHTRQHALHLGVIGYVRNCADGSVEVVAEGKREAVQDLLNWLHEGPTHALVERVEANWKTAIEQLASFEVRY
jgi:acylphosphatase